MRRREWVRSLAMLNVVVRLCTSLQQDQRLDGQGMYHFCTDISDIQELLPGNEKGGRWEWWIILCSKWLWTFGKGILTWSDVDNTVMVLSDRWWSTQSSNIITFYTQKHQTADRRGTETGNIQLKILLLATLSVWNNSEDISEEPCLLCRYFY